MNHVYYFSVTLSKQHVNPVVMQVFFVQPKLKDLAKKKKKFLCIFKLCHPLIYTKPCAILKENKEGGITIKDRKKTAVKKGEKKAEQVTKKSFLL